MNSLRGVLLCALLVPAPAAGQLQLSAFELSLSNPGARSLGLGGAFVALADDATAAYANPAGLVQLARPELSIEGRSWGYTTTVPVTGRAAGEPTGIGLDNTAGPRPGDFSADLSELSFLSYSWPLDRWSFAVYRHQLARFESSVERHGYFGPAGSQSLLLPLDGGLGPADTVRSFAARGSVSMDSVGFGAAVGVRLGDSLSVGISLAQVDTALRITGGNYLPDDDSPEGFFGESSHLPERRYYEADLRSDGADWTWNAGLLWRFDRQWSLGAVYRSGWEVGFRNNVRTGQAWPLGPVDVIGTGEIGFPSVFGFGVAYRAAGDRLTLAAEWDRVEYSKLLRSFGDDDDTLSDGEEVRLGGEYVFTRPAAVVALRLGAWLEPDHRLRAESDDPFVRTSQPVGNDETHLAGGVGLVFEVFQLDIAVDLSEVVDTASISVVYTW